MKALIDATEQPDFPARVIIVGADSEAPGLAYAKNAGINTFVERPRDYADRDEWAKQVLNKIQEHGVATRDNPGLIVSAGFMRILPASFVKQVSPQIINTHPALLPLYPGAHAVRDALAAGAKETGTTVHIVDEGVDTGPILASRKLEIFEGESADELHERIKQLERPLLVDTVKKIARGEILLKDKTKK